MSTMFAVTTVTYLQRQCRRSKRHGHKITSMQEKVMHLNLADYLYNLEAIAKETGELDNLKINYVMNYEDVSCYELHQLNAIECILRVRRIQLPPASPTVHACHRSSFMYVMF